jgi:hypothetical protein
VDTVWSVPNIVAAAPWSNAAAGKRERYLSLEVMNAMVESWVFRNAAKDSFPGAELRDVLKSRKELQALFCALVPFVCNPSALSTKPEIPIGYRGRSTTPLFTAKRWASGSAGTTFLLFRKKTFAPHTMPLLLKHVRKLPKEVELLKADCDVNVLREFAVQAFVANTVRVPQRFGPLARIAPRMIGLLQCQPHGANSVIVMEQLVDGLPMRKVTKQFEIWNARYGRTFNERFRTTFQYAVSLRMADALYATISQLHANGVVHHDLHAGNLLVFSFTLKEPTSWTTTTTPNSVFPLPLIKVLDFGRAVVWDKPAEKTTLKQGIFMDVLRIYERLSTHHNWVDFKRLCVGLLTRQKPSLLTDAYASYPANTKILERLAALNDARVHFPAEERTTHTRAKNVWKLRAEQTMMRRRALRTAAVVPTALSPRVALFEVVDVLESYYVKLCDKLNKRPSSELGSHILTWNDGRVQFHMYR